MKEKINVKIIIFIESISMNKFINLTETLGKRKYLHQTSLTFNQNQNKITIET